MGMIIFGIGTGVITAMAGVSVIETPIKAIVTIVALALLHDFTR